MKAIKAWLTKKPNALDIAIMLMVVLNMWFIMELIIINLGGL